MARFEKTYCSQCGSEFGPGDCGFSHCSSHGPQFKVGDDVFVYEPARFVPDVLSITGAVLSIAHDMVTISACQCFTYPRPYAYDEIIVPINQIGHRIGTPLSQLSGRPGHAGYDRFCAIAESYGCD